MKTKEVIENGFKETEIGLIPEDWETTTLENEKLFEFTNGLWKGKKAPCVTAKVIRNTNFNNDGTLSLDDVAELDVEEKQFVKRQLSGGDIILERSGGGPKQPVGRVVFFDLKEVNYSFSNFTTRIRVKDINKIQPKYILYYLLHFYNRGCTYELQQRTTGIRNLNFKDYKKIQVPLPSLTEQRKIAFVLLKIQQAIEQQHKIIETTRELKKSLMNKLFIEGLHGEEQKETEIGLMPKSWDVERVNEVYNFTKKQNKFDIKQHKKIPFIPMKYISEQQRIVDKYDLKEKISSGTFVLKGDLIVAKITPSFENGKQGIVDNIPFEFVYATTEVWPIHNREGKSNINFLHYYLKKPDIRNEIAGKMEGSTGRQRVPKNVLENLKIPFPRYVEQGEISGIFISSDVKISQAESKKQTLQALFRTMLNQLMTGKVRVKDFDFEVKENV